MTPLDAFPGGAAEARKQITDLRDSFNVEDQRRGDTTGRYVQMLCGVQLMPLLDLALIGIDSLDPEREAKPDGYAYRYPRHSGGTVIRFTNGEPVNGSSPIEALPYYFKSPAPPSPSVAALLDLSNEMRTLVPNLRTDDYRKPAERLVQALHGLGLWREPPKDGA